MAVAEAADDSEGMMGGIESGGGDVAGSLAEAGKRNGSGAENGNGNGTGRTHEGWDLRVPLAYNNK